MAATVLNQEAGARAELPLPSFRVAGYRAFRDFRIAELGRVNLFVGMNNSGKTSLLEAIHLYASGANSLQIRQILFAREEFGRTAEPEALDAALNRLFHTGGGSRESSISIGPLSVPDRELTMQRGWASSYSVGDSVVTRFDRSAPHDLVGDFERAIEVRRGHADPRVISDRRLLTRLTFGAALAAATQLLYPALFVTANGLSTEEVASAWDRVALTDEEDLVTDALRIIAPSVERISVVGNADGTDDRRVMLRVGGQNTPVPLRTMGDGMNRLLGISLALANVRNGILLVDEVENGIHYSVQADMWRAILDAARSLNVQVFATTHSWDCIRAFAAATSEDDDSDAMLYRLDQRIEEQVRAVRYTADEVAIAAEQQIEVR